MTQKCKLWCRLPTTSNSNSKEVNVTCSSRKYKPVENLFSKMLTKCHEKALTSIYWPCTCTLAGRMNHIHKCFRVFVPLSLSSIFSHCWFHKLFQRQLSGAVNGYSAVCDWKSKRKWAEITALFATSNWIALFTQTPEMKSIVSRRMQ